MSDTIKLTNRQILLQEISKELSSLTREELLEIEAFIESKKIEIAGGLQLANR